jgi:hypothetical protein
VKASQDMIFQSDLKTDGDTMRMVHVTHHRGGHVEIKLNMDGSIRRTASDPATLILLFFMYQTIGAL